MRKLSSLLLLLVCSNVLAHDEYSTNSSGDYAMDLGQVYGAIRSTRFIGEICSESFADQIQTNAAAFAAWRKRYLPFMQEMEKHFSQMAWREAGGDPQKLMKFLAAADASFDGIRAGLKAQMTADGTDSLAIQCELFPSHLASARMDLEHYYAEQVAVIRNGPPK